MGESGSRFGHSLGAITSKDIRRANHLEEILPGYLGIPERRIRVVAGSGVIHVEISGISDPAGKVALIAKLHDLEVNNPAIDPIKLRVYPLEGSIFIHPTLIQR